jgi:hypothetical protein
MEISYRLVFGLSDRSTKPNFPLSGLLPFLSSSSKQQQHTVVLPLSADDSWGCDATSAGNLCNNSLWHVEPERRDAHASGFASHHWDGKNGANPPTQNGHIRSLFGVVAVMTAV